MTSFYNSFSFMRDQKKCDFEEKWIFNYLIISLTCAAPVEGGQTDVFRLMDCPQCISSRSLQTGSNVHSSWLIKTGRAQAAGAKRAEAVPLPSGFLFSGSADLVLTLHLPVQQSGR